jgi:hypothetical protein
LYWVVWIDSDGNYRLNGFPKERKMKKLISILMVFWLPLFLSTASYASTKMHAQEEPSTVVAVDHEAMASSDHGAEHDLCSRGSSEESQDSGHQDSSSHGQCQHCGFCVALVFYTAPVINDLPLAQHPLSAHIAWVSSPHVTATDQRPPITA